MDLKFNYRKYLLATGVCLNLNLEIIHGVVENFYRTINSIEYWFNSINHYLSFFNWRLLYSKKIKNAFRIKLFKITVSYLRYQCGIYLFIGFAFYTGGLYKSSLTQTLELWEEIKVTVGADVSVWRSWEDLFTESILGLNLTVGYGPIKCSFMYYTRKLFFVTPISTKLK